MKKRLVILGGGESGVGAAVLGCVKGFDVFLSDVGSIKPAYLEMLQRYGIACEQGGHTEALVLNADEVVKSPGMPDTAPMVKKLVEAGVPVISEVELAARYTGAKLVCVTGSNGKTTTTALIYHIMKSAGLNVGLGGNIGRSFALQVATENYDYYVLELSSFQLDGMYRFKADVAVLLNITPDHMDRYGYKLENYARSKFRIAQNMDKKGFFIYCADDEVTMKYLAETQVKAQLLGFSQKKKVAQGACLNNNKFMAMYKNNSLEMLLDELSLRGKHNLYNSMAASIAGQVLKIKKEHIRNSLMCFENIEHRLEPVLRVGGILFINDSKATNINSTWYALESMTSPTVWIAGGVDKGNDYGELLELVKQKVKAIVCLGVDNHKIHEAFKGVVSDIVDTRSAEEAVKEAYKLAKKGDAVLLSPACASFDLFQSYEDRGKQFKAAIRYL
ncbi:MAG: UDP-N-acetylmuramoyl-L-alanine--D-glutamate ligase [Prevotellaceae bacterium]|jgi:UDP-N-acetylmuramoylalanine--D-glutamate ligase|nr:UDP-N-acetylmuramoyl-L-alanine--D-glutamate ligase [Prevotellaceae bacterium]